MDLEASQLIPKSQFIGIVLVGFGRELERPILGSRRPAIILGPNCNPLQAIILPEEISKCPLAIDHVLAWLEPSWITGAPKETYTQGPRSKMLTSNVTILRQISSLSSKHHTGDRSQSAVTSDASAGRIDLHTYEVGSTSLFVRRWANPSNFRAPN